MILRSMLFVPGHNEEYLRKATQSKADAVIIDLEDSVPFLDNKIRARQISRKLIDEGIFTRQHVFIRLNSFDSGLLSDDVKALMCKGVTGFVFPKSKQAEDIQLLDKLLTELESFGGYKSGHFCIIPLIETCSAVLHAEEICRASTRVVAIAFGCEDFVADLRGIHDENGISLNTPRAMIAMAARATGVIPIDTVHVKVHDIADLIKNLRVSAILGFEGMLLLHPKEIEHAHLYFTPSEVEYLRAKEDLRLTELAYSEGKGVAVQNGRFLGPPMHIAAHNLIQRYDAILIWEQNRGNSL